MSRVSDLFDRALRRPHAPLSGSASPVWEEDGAQVAFLVETGNGVVTRADYRCTTCATLVAACEAIVEFAAGTPVPQALALTPESLLSLMGGVPPQRHSRLRAAVKAFHAAF